jgi:MFS family permease
MSSSDAGARALTAVTEAVPSERQKAIRVILCFGIVSFFADATYEGAHSIVGPFLRELNATAFQVGFIAGLGEMIAASLRFFSGRLVDRTKAYWTISFIGYGMNLIVVPALAFAGNWQAAALLVVAERTGKGIRGPARDVLLSEATQHVGHGWGFGLHAAMDQAGAVAVAHAQVFGRAFLVLGIPALGALLALVAARFLDPWKERKSKAYVPQPLPPIFWPYIIAAGVIALGFVDFPLLAYHFEKAQLFDRPMIPLLFAMAMGVNGLVALVLGKLFDRFGLVVLSLGLVASAAALPLGFLGGARAGVAAVALWAVGMGAQDATLRAGISQVVSMNKRGSAFGLYNAVYGVMWFAGSLVMGKLYDVNLTVALVAFGVAAQIAAAGAFVWLARRLRPASA